MIGALLGYPHELWERVRHWSEQIMLLAGQTSPDGPPHVTHPGIVPVIGEFVEVTTALIRTQVQPHDDLHLALGPRRGVGHQAHSGRGDPRSRQQGRTTAPSSVR